MCASDTLEHRTLIENIAPHSFCTQKSTIRNSRGRKVTSRRWDVKEIVTFCCVLESVEKNQLVDDDVQSDSTNPIRTCERELQIDLIWTRAVVNISSQMCRRVSQTCTWKNSFSNDGRWLDSYLYQDSFSSSRPLTKSSLIIASLRKIEIPSTICT